MKYFCDGCGDEITDENKCAGGAVNCDTRFGGEVIAKSGVRLKVEIMTSLDGATNKGSFCKDCVVNAIVELAKPIADKPKLRPLREPAK